MQRASIYLFLSDALQVSDGFSVHHQELKTATAVRLARLAAGSSNGLYVLVWAPDDGRKNRLKHVERLTEINWDTLIYSHSTTNKMQRVSIYSFL